MLGLAQGQKICMSNKFPSHNDDDDDDVCGLHAVQVVLNCIGNVNLTVCVKVRRGMLLLGRAAKL